MQNLFFRLVRALLWLSERLKSLAYRRRRRAGIFGLITFLGVFVLANPVFAQTGEQGILDWIFEGLGNLALAIAGWLSMMVVSILNMTIPIMLYNDFSNNPIVTAGWALVRDTVNMFFVIVLIIIAFGTIFGHSRFQWQQQIPKLMIFAVVINFSKTLCGLMIDFGQVIMLTFANALQSIAAGNFIQLLGMGDIYSVSTATQTIQNRTGTAAFDWFASGLAAVFMMLIVFLTMLILLVILVYRVVMLWVMIVLAPLAWFIGGAGGANGILRSNAYAQWWERFKCLVAIGPVLTFFLWLTLAVAGAGNIARQSGFNVESPTGIKNPSGILSGIFELDRLMSFVIGIAMLYAGFEAAQSICSSMSGTFLGKQLAGKSPLKAPISRVALGAGAKGGAFLTRQAYRPIGAIGRGVRRSGAELLGDTRVPFTRRGRAALARTALQKTEKLPGGKTIQKLVAPVAEKYATGLDQKKRDEIAKAGIKFKDHDTSSKLNMLERFAESGASTFTGGKFQAQALLMEAMGDKDMMKQLRASGSLKKLWQQHGSEIQETYATDSKSREKLENFQKQNADVTDSAHLLNDVDDLKNLSDAAFADPKIKESLENKTVMHKGESRTMAWMVQNGLAGDRKKQIFEQGMEANYSRMSDRELERVQTNELVRRGNLDTLDRAITVSMNTGDLARIDKIGESIREMYRIGGTQEERTHAGRSMERFEQSLERLQKSETLSGVRQNQAHDMREKNKDLWQGLVDLNEGRMNDLSKGQAIMPTAEAFLTDIPQSTNEFGSDRGAHGVYQGGTSEETVEDFVQRNFANAPSDVKRQARDDADKTYEKLEEKRDKAVGRAEADVNIFSSLEESIRDLTESVNAQVQAEMPDAFSDLREAQVNMAEAPTPEARTEYKKQAYEIAQAISRRKSTIMESRTGDSGAGAGMTLLQMNEAQKNLNLSPKQRDQAINIANLEQQVTVQQHIKDKLDETLPAPAPTPTA